MEILYCTWTGGWDSTFMVIQQLKLNRTIQPIYVIDKGRDGRTNEIEAIDKIINELEKQDFLGGKILPVKMIDKEEIGNNPEITQSYNNICSKIRLGSQYEWLANLALEYPNLAIGIEKPNGEFSGCVTAIEKNGNLVYRDNIGYIDKENSNDDCNKIFGNFSFPIINMTESEMLSNIREWNLEDIMKNIWFCHRPINNKPCGMCRPCQQKMECKMEFLLPTNSQKRYTHFRKIEKKLGARASAIYSKIMHKIGK